MFENLLGGLMNNIGGGAENQAHELIDKLKSTVGLSDEQADKVVETIKHFIVEKYPMLQGAVENILGKK